MNDFVASASSRLLFTGKRKTKCKKAGWKPALRNLTNRGEVGILLWHRARGQVDSVGIFLFC